MLEILNSAFVLCAALREVSRLCAAVKGERRGAAKAMKAQSGSQGGIAMSGDPFQFALFVLERVL